MTSLNNMIVFDQETSYVAEELEVNTDRNKWSLVKLTSSVIYGHEKKKADVIKKFVQDCRQNSTIPFIWGWVTDRYVSDNDLYSLTKLLHGHEIDTIEIPSDLSEKIGKVGLEETINKAKQDFDRVIVEVGSKYPSGFPTPYNRSFQSWIIDIALALDLWIKDIVLEWGWDGNTWIYNYLRMPKTMLVSTIMRHFSDRVDDIIIEAPYLNQQKFWISLLWPRVRFWNTRIEADKQKSLNRTRDKAKKSPSHMIYFIAENVFELSKKHWVSPDLVIFDDELCKINYSAYKESEYPELKQRIENRIVEISQGVNMGHNGPENIFSMLFTRIVHL